MIRDLSKYARRVALGAMTALALLAGSAVSNTASAQYNHGTDGKIENGDIASNAMVAFQIYQWGKFLYVAVSDCNERYHGRPGRDLSMRELVWSDSAAKARDEAYAKTPAALVSCLNAIASTKAEMQDGRMKAAGIDTTKARYTAQAIDVGAETRNALNAQYASAMGFKADNVASVR